MLIVRGPTHDAASACTLLLDRAAPVEARREAALALGHVARCDRAAAQALLLQVVDGADEPRLLRAAAKSLGWIGDATAHAAVAAAARCHDGPVAAQVAFAARLIAARLRLPTPGLPPLAVGPTLGCEGGEPLRIEPATPEALACCAAELGERAPELDPSLGLAFSCHAAQRMLLFAPDLLAAATRSGTPSLPALVATWLDDRERHVITHLVLLEPGRGADRRLVVCLTTGEPVFAGKLRVRAGSLHFFVEAVARPGAFPLQFAGRITDDEITIDLARAGPVQVPRRRPLPLPDPPFGS